MKIPLRSIWMLLLFTAVSCSSKKDRKIEFERISFYNFPVRENDSPFQYKDTYYKEGIPQRWTELKPNGDTLVDYLYLYNLKGLHVGAKYKEPEDKQYSLERVTFLNDSTQVTEWLDSVGKVYYKMIDNLNKHGKTYRATFIGDTLHGYDSTFYTAQGFEERIFFTNTKGKRLNERFYQYFPTNDFGDWTTRRKIVKDSVHEVQKRVIKYLN